MKAAVWALLALVATAPAGPAWGQPAGAEAHWPLPPGELERRLAQDEFEILSVRGGVGGVMGVKKLTVLFPASGEELAVKWKEAPRGDADGWNNTPRKEIAAYEIQKWFLDPEDYVVPTTVLRCLPLDAYDPIDARPQATLAGGRCVIGTLVVWLDNVTVPDDLYEEERFAADSRYAYHIANMNILTYLIEHEDGRRGNFLTSEDETDRRVFSIDNGVAFGAIVKNFLPWVTNWHKIRVPALDRGAIARLRRVGGEDLLALGVVAEMRADESGILRSVAVTQNADPGKGVRVKSGWIQLGLSRREIDKLQRRLDQLIAGVDAGRQPLF